MKKLTFMSLTAVFAAALAGCGTTANTNVRVNTNSNTAVVVNNNTAVSNTGATNANASTNANKDITRADYDREKDRYAREAKEAGSTIGTGINDGWLHTKTKLALATTADLRDSTINVDVNNEVVTLRGTVATKAESEKAAAVAKGIEGVKSVTNQLKVQANDSLTNQMVNSNTSATNANKK